MTERPPSIARLAGALRDGTTSARELTAAAAADAELAAGRDRGTLHGIPVAVKDIIDVAGVPTRYGTAGFGHRVPGTDAEVVRRLREAGAIVVGKTRTHELAWGMITPECGNPRAPDRMTGGSSGGSAAAVAAGIVPLALGTDTSGSIRNPAALCGVVGFKAAPRTVPTAGVAAMAPTQDSIGVFATSVADCRAAMARVNSAVAEPVAAGAAGLRVGLVADRWAQRVDPPVSGALAAARDRLTDAGTHCAEVHVPYSELAPSISFVVMLAESAAEWWPMARDDTAGLGRAVRDSLRLGIRVRAVDYLRALAARDALVAAITELLDDVDVLLLASCPVTAPRHGTTSVRIAERDEDVATAFARLTALASVAGLPAMSVPAGCDADGLPIGLQLVGRNEAAIAAAAELVRLDI